MFYSAQTGGFYDSSINRIIPGDVVEITENQHAALLAGQSAGQVIISDANGYPVLADPPPPTLAELRERSLSMLPAWEQTERSSGIEHAGHTWLTTPAAMQDIRDVLLAGAVSDEQWVTADRQVVPMTLAGLQSLWQAITTRGAAIYRRRLQLEADIAAMDAEQLTAFVPGWPA